MRDVEVEVRSFCNFTSKSYIRYLEHNNFNMAIELRAWTLADVKDLVTLCNSVDRSYLSDRLPYPYIDEDAKRWLNMVVQNDSVTGVYRAIIVDGHTVGSISVEQKNDVYQIDGEIGFMLHDKYWNKGIMTEAVKQISMIAFRKLPLERITANVFQPNIASIHVLRKIGFIHEATLRNAVIKKGKIFNLCIFGLVKQHP